MMLQYGGTPVPETFTPFFEMADSEYLVLDQAGRVLCLDGNRTILIAGDLKDFLRELVDDPEFYIRKITVASLPS